MESNANLLETRYGQKPPRDPKNFRRFAIVGVTALTLTAMWFGIANYSPVSYQNIGFRVISELQTEVDFELTKPANATVVCSVEALNNAFATVGWIELEFGPSELQTIRHTVSLITTELAVTGLVDECNQR
jgi:hypothetical protein